VGCGSRHALVTPGCRGFSPRQLPSRASSCSARRSRIARHVTPCALQLGEPTRSHASSDACSKENIFRCASNRMWAAMNSSTEVPHRVHWSPGASNRSFERARIAKRPTPNSLRGDALLRAETLRSTSPTSLSFRTLRPKYHTPSGPKPRRCRSFRRNALHRLPVRAPDGDDTMFTRRTPRVWSGLACPPSYPAATSLSRSFHWRRCHHLLVCSHSVFNEHPPERRFSFRCPTP
jgi:hypothetical protein